MTTKGVLALLLICISTVSFSSEYPLYPDPTLTPGILCQYPDSYRYPEHIAYCKRDVSYAQKKQVFEDYRHLGYRINLKRRSDYKIDHYIPLCAGGGNNIENLWPQHKSVFRKTDQIEFLGCELLRDGRISQHSLIALIRYAKNDHTKVEEVMEELRSL